MKTLPDTIEFPAWKNGSSIISLKEILDLLPTGDRCRWSILDLWATGSASNYRSIKDLEHNIKSAKAALTISWQELRELADSIQQIIETTIVGCNSVDLARDSDDDSLRKYCEYVFKMSDSSYWTIYSKDRELIDRLRQNFI